MFFGDENTLNTTPLMCSDLTKFKGVIDKETFIISNNLLHERIVTYPGEPLSWKDSALRKLIATKTVTKTKKVKSRYESNTF